MLVRAATQVPRESEKRPMDQMSEGNMDAARRPERLGNKPEFSLSDERPRIWRRPVPGALRTRIVSSNAIKDVVERDISAFLVAAFAGFVLIHTTT
jgi:hypothetical protein